MSSLKKVILIAVCLKCSSIWSDNLNSNFQNEFAADLVTLGSTNSLDSSWGHTNLRIYNPHLQKHILYDYGVFNLKSNFLKSYLKNKNSFKLVRRDWHKSLRRYIKQKRTVTIQTIHVKPEKIEGLFKKLEALRNSDERNYRYSNISQNCVTKVRDDLNYLLNDEIKKNFEPLLSTRTYRDHGLNPLKNNPFFLFFVSLITNWHVDLPINQYEELYLPNLLQEGLKKLHRENPKIVGKVQTIYKSNELPAIPWVSWFIIISIFCAGLSLILLQKRTLSLFFITSFSIVISLFGFLLLFLATYARLDFISGNINILNYHPGYLCIFYFIFKHKTNWQTYSKLLFYAMAINASIFVSSAFGLLSQNVLLTSAVAFLLNLLFLLMVRNAVSQPQLVK